MSDPCSASTAPCSCRSRSIGHAAVMDLSWDSLRFPQDTRPASCKVRAEDRGAHTGALCKPLTRRVCLLCSQFVELHVLYVPDDYWDAKLHKVPAEAVERFISAGFIRCTRYRARACVCVGGYGGHMKLDICKCQSECVVFLWVAKRLICFLKSSLFTFFNS